MPARTVTVEVTAEDIARGKRGHGRSCALQRALARALGDNQVSVSYNLKEAFLYAPSTQFFTYSLPDPCLVFVKAFDDDKPVKPFSFELTLP